MTSDRPTVRQLEYVVAVAEHGNFSRAAEACGVSQPALSAQIQEAEQRLGMTLFERGRSGVSVPAHAQPVIERAKRAISAVDDVVLAATDNSDEIVGPLGVGVIPTMAPYLLPTLVNQLRRRHPRAKPALYEERTDDLVRRISSGEIDIGMLADPVPSNELEVVKVADDPFHIAMSDDHPFAGEGPLPSGVLNGLEVLLLEDGHCLRDQAIEVCAAAGQSEIATIQATSLATLCQMVAAGQGVTLLPACALPVETRQGSGLISRPLTRPTPHRTVVIAWRRTAPNRALYARFADSVADAIQTCCSSPGRSLREAAT